MRDLWQRFGQYVNAHPIEALAMAYLLSVAIGELADGYLAERARIKRMEADTVAALDTPVQRGLLADAVEREPHDETTPSAIMAGIVAEATRDFEPDPHA